ncbi:hypothetical protein ACRRTK_001815 [Alexandromys fortis]
MGPDEVQEENTEWQFKRKQDALGCITGSLLLFPEHFHVENDLYRKINSKINKETPSVTIAYFGVFTPNSPFIYVGKYLLFGTGKWCLAQVTSNDFLNHLKRTHPLPCQKTATRLYFSGAKGTDSKDGSKQNKRSGLGLPTLGPETGGTDTLSKWPGSPISHSSNELDVWTDFCSHTNSNASTVSGHLSPILASTELDDIQDDDAPLSPKLYSNSAACHPLDCLVLVRLQYAARIEALQGGLFKLTANINDKENSNNKQTKTIAVGPDQCSREVHIET